MKRILCLLLVLALCFSLGACKFTGTKKTIKTDLEESLDIILSEEGADFVYASPIAKDPSNTIVNEEISAMIRENTTYKINSIRYSGNTAQADVTFTSPDAYKMVCESYNTSELDMIRHFYEWLGSKNYPETTTDVTINLQYNPDEDQWKPEESEELNDAINGGLVSSKDDIAEVGDLDSIIFEAEKIINNGGSAVEYKGNLYYFAPVKENADSPGTFTYELFMRSADGTIKSLGLQSSSYYSKIYISNDKLYVTSYGTLYEMTLEGEVISTLEDKSIALLDESTSSLVLEPHYDSGYHYVIYNTETSTSTPMEEIWGNLAISTCNGFGYFYSLPMSLASFDRNELELYSYEFKTGRAELLSSINKDNLFSDIVEHIEINHIQETKNYLYVLYENRNGMHNFYGSGTIIRYNKETGEEDARYNTSYNPRFYVFEENGTDMLLYCKGMDSNFILNTETNEEQKTDMLLGNLEEATEVISDNTPRKVRYVYYADTTGKATEILPERTLEINGEYVYTQNVNYTGSYTVYTLDYRKNNPNALSARSDTISYKRETYLYNIASRETTLLCSTDGTPATSQSFGSTKEISDKIVAHYNNLATLSEGETYVIFESETKTSDNKITFVLRFQSNDINAPANKLVDRIFVDTTTGTVTEEMRGNSWQLE